MTSFKLLKRIVFFSAIFLVSTPSAFAQKQRAAGQLAAALDLAAKGNYEAAVPTLFKLSRSDDFKSERIQIKYILGTALLELKLNQIAAFQFVDVIRSGNSQYTKQAIEQLTVAADALGDDTLLNYAISKVQISDVPKKYKDMIFFRLGEIKLKRGEYMEALNFFQQVAPDSRYGSQAQFNRGLAMLEDKRPREALKVFRAMRASRAKAPVTDTNRVAAQIAIARSLYQAKDWDGAIEAYRAVPRDHELWHSALFEMSWAQLQSVRFRSVLSNFHSLHSAYYEDHYLPESLILRAIVYLYICKYDEMEKVLGLFDKTYAPMRTLLSRTLQKQKDPLYYTAELDRVDAIRREKKPSGALKLPYSVVRHLLDEGDIKRAYTYIRRLNQESARLQSLGGLSRTAFSGYAQKVLMNRVKNTRISMGEMARNHLMRIQAELNELYEQSSLARYEMINGQKETLKKKIAGKALPTAIDEDVQRDYYIQNGFEYWPFDGEYWLDEIGNYHYLGRQNCE